MLGTAELFSIACSERQQEQNLIKLHSAAALQFEHCVEVDNRHVVVSHLDTRIVEGMMMEKGLYSKEESNDCSFS